MLLLRDTLRRHALHARASGTASSRRSMAVAQSSVRPEEVEKKPSAGQELPHRALFAHRPSTASRANGSSRTDEKRANGVAQPQSQPRIKAEAAAAKPGSLSQESIERYDECSPGSSPNADVCGRDADR